MTVLDERRFSPAALASLAGDAAHLGAVLEVVADQLRELQARQAALRLQQVPAGAARLHRDLEIEAVSKRLHTLSRLGTDVCLGRFDRRDGSTVYVGRLGLRDAEGHDGVDLATEAVARATALLDGGGTAVVVLDADRQRPRAPDSIGFCVPEDLSGLEMDVVVVVEPAELWPDDDAAAPSLYVTLTRATQAVVVLHQRELPVCALPLTRHLATAPA